MMKKKLMTALDVATIILLILKLKSITYYITYTIAYRPIDSIEEITYRLFLVEFFHGSINILNRFIMIPLILITFALYIYNLTMIILKISDVEDGKEQTKGTWYMKFFLVNVVFVILQTVMYLIAVNVLNRL